MHALHRSAVALTLAAFASLTLIAPHARADVSGADIVGFVNAQRAANGFPAGIVEDTAASAACATWATTGNHANGSSPIPPTGGITWTGGGLVPDIGPWTATHDPFEDDAVYLPDVLAPRLASFGAAEIGGLGCATLRQTGTRPAPAQDVTYTYPGDGAQDTRTSQPLVTSGRFGDTSDQAAMAQGGTPTRGAMLYAFFDGPDFDPAHAATAKATSATLAGPDGAPVTVDVRDATTPFNTSYLPTEVQVIPRNALKPYTKYTASVAADVTVPGGSPARSFSRTWSFTTGGLENFAGLGYGGGTLTAGDPSLVTFEVQSRAPVVTVSATGPGTPASVTTTIAPGAYIPQWATLRLDRPGAWHVCVRSGGLGTDFRPAEGCRDMTAGAVPKAATPPVVTPAPKPAPKLVVSLGKGVKARWSGRTVSVPVRCSAKCSLRVAGTVRAGDKTIRLGTRTVTRKGAGTVTIRYTMSKATVARLHRAKVRRLALTIVAKGAPTVRKTVAISAK